MMSRRISLLLFSACLLLAGCATTGTKTFLYQGPADMEGQKCVMACKQSRLLCKNTCNPNAKQCQQEAVEEYRQYVEQRQIMGLPVARTLKQQIQSRGCAPHDCGCDADYRSCYELCGGTVNPK